MKQTMQNGFWFAKTTTFFDLHKLTMVLLLAASVTACNSDEYYAKNYAENPQPDDTVVTTGGSNGGDSSGVDGSTQGGVDSGVTSGTTDGTTGGSSGDSTSGGTSTGGSTDGSTAGGSSTGGSTDGSTSGGSTTGDSTSGSTSGGSTTGGSTTGSTSGGSTTGSTNGGTIGDCNNGHGNEDDQFDEGNPGNGLGESQEYCWASDEFQQAAEQSKKIDIVWIVDDSGSMADEQAALADNFDSFIRGFINKGSDFKMAITTTDTSSSAKKGKAVDGSLTALTSAAAAADEQQFMNNFMNMVKVGTSGSGYEKGLAASEGFVQKYGADWLRPDAYLAVVILSDEEDQSSQAVKHYTDFLKEQKSQEGLVKVYTIVNVNDVATGGNTIGHVRYEEASQRTGGVMSNIMDRFDSVLMEMGDSIINLLDSFALSHVPEAGSIKVFVNGVETTNFSYDSATRSIKFDQGNLPPVGAEVKVKYIRKI